jgi:hypothetical protein
MNISFIIQVTILTIVKWSYRSSPNKLTIGSRMETMFWAHSPISFRHTSFWYLKSHLTNYHTSLIYSCLIKRSNWIAPTSTLGECMVSIININNGIERNLHVDIKIVIPIKYWYSLDMPRWEHLCIPKLLFGSVPILKVILVLWRFSPVWGFSFYFIFHGI